MSFRVLQKATQLLNNKEFINLIPSIVKGLETDHPLLQKVAKYYFEASGKRLRPQLLLSIGQTSGELSAKHYELAKITEIIHTASLLHDDVLDSASIRRNLTSSNGEFGNKITVLAGDFLLAKASGMLADLGNLEIVKLMATILQDLVKGELMQLTPCNTRAEISKQMEVYVDKCYYKTGSLISNSCKSSIILSACSHLGDEAFLFGKHFGIAFQVIDDKLDFTSSHLGKTQFQDLKNRLLTAPYFYAFHEKPEIADVISSQDFTKVAEIILDSNAIKQTQTLAEKHMQIAKSHLSKFRNTENLFQLCDETLTREK